MPDPKPSGTVVIVREAEPGLEVLLLERATRQPPAAWVFPGGKVEAGDRLDPTSGAVELARRAAVREAHEEAGVALDADTLVPISRWITPEVVKKRFDTWFFVANVAPEVEVRVDGGEIAAHRWITPARALETFHAGSLRLAPPTFVTVSWLAEHADAAAALAGLRRDPVPEFRPLVCPREEGVVILYAGDAGYEARDPDRPGPRHRLWARGLGSGYRYERSPDALG